MRFVLVAVLSTVAMSPAMAQETSADRAISTNPKTVGFVDKVLGMVEAADPDQQLTGKQQFEQYLMSTIGPVPLIGEAAGSAINHWTNTPEEYGQGWGAFGKRYASNLGYNAVRQTVGYGLGAVFHEDNRYFASRKTGFWPRTRHALASTFLARHPDGNYMFSISGTAGVISAAAAQSAWSPGSMKGRNNIAESAALSFASTAAFNVIREFLPEILGRKKK